MNKIISKINSAKDVEGVFAIAMLFIAIILLSIIPLVTEASTGVTMESLPENKVFNDFVVGPERSKSNWPLENQLLLNYLFQID
jgi:hypothetical protein